MRCYSCDVVLCNEMQHYKLSEIGVELSAVIAEILNREIDYDGYLCEDCFITARNQLSSEAINQSINYCVWCERSIVGQHSHRLPSCPETNYITLRILPRQILPGQRVCYACWLAARRNVQRAQMQDYNRTEPQPQVIIEQPLTSLPEPSTSQPEPSTSRPEPFTSQPEPSTSQPEPSTPQSEPSTSQPEPSTPQPEPSTPQPEPSTSQPEPSTPQPEPSTSLPETSTSLPGTSTSQLEQSTSQPEQSTSQPQPSTARGLICVWCQRVIRHHPHSLPECPERDHIARCILPRQIEPHSKVCYACWLAAHRNVTREVPPGLQHQIPLPNYRRTGNSSNTCFVHGCINSERLSVPTFLKYRLLKSYKLYVTESARVCHDHLCEYDWDFLNEHSYLNQFSPAQLEATIKLALGNEVEIKLDFEQLHSMPDEICKYWTGLTKENFCNVLRETSLLGERLKKSKTALAIFLTKLRTGEPHSRLGQLFSMSESTVSKVLSKVRYILNEQFVPLHMGIGHLQREEIVNHNLIIPQGLFGGGDEGRRKAIVICDGTYVYLEKSSNYLFQKKSYSLHKYRNLIKPFLIVATDGHILDIKGPYGATVSDADIMKQLFENENNELRQYFREGDVFILDRGFRDAIQLLTSLNYNVYKPESLEPGETQLPTLRANKSRHVTMCRWVVEVVNGRFKRDFKIVRNDFNNNAAPHLMMDFRIAGALINAFHVPITDRPDAPLILERALHRLTVPNDLGDFIIQNNINRRRALFVDINAENILLNEFPVLTKSDLILFSLGTYQIKQARSYFGEHIRQNGSFSIQVCHNIETLHMPNSAIEMILLRGRIKSRHHTGKIYYIYILLNMNENDWERRIHGYYCNCIVGKRTVGCCAHVMSIIWYMAWARFQANITAPATFLDNILVRDDVENEDAE